MPTYLSPGVYIEEVESGGKPIEGVSTAVAAFVGLAPQGPVNIPTLVTNWSQYTQIFGEFADGCYLAHSVYGYFMNGGGAAYIVRAGGEDDANGYNGSAPKELAAVPQGEIGGFRISAKPEAITAAEGKQAPPVTVEIFPSETPEGADEALNVVVRRGNKVEESFPNLSVKRGKDNIATVLREKSRMITIDEAPSATALVKLPQGRVVLTAPADAPPASLSADDYVGDVNERTGIAGLESIEEITMVAVPDLMSAYQRGAIDLETVQAVQLSMIAHCELMGDRMAIIDPPPGLSAQQIKEWRMDKAGYDSKFAAMYYPWIQVHDPLSGTNQLLPPSGHMAGIWARNDATRGVHKAPANEVIRGAVGLPTQLTRIEQELLNPIGVNCIRSFPGRGIRVWGARTLSSDAAWRYLNVRRLFNYIEESILAGTQWVVFEPNDDFLWGRIRRTIAAFLTLEWQRGALFGMSADEAFYVRCDRETNSAETIDAGQVICEIGIAPVKPAEFVVFRLAQMQSGTSLVNE